MGFNDKDMNVLYLDIKQRPKPAKSYNLIIQALV